MNRLLEFVRYYEWESFVLRNFRIIFQVIVFLLSALILSQLILTVSPLQVILTLFVAFFIYIIIINPEIGILTIIFIMVSIINVEALPFIPIPVERFFITDFIHTRAL